MERRVDLLKRMQSSPILIQGFFASYLFIALMLLSVMVVMTALLVVTVGKWLQMRGSGGAVGARAH